MKFEPGYLKLYHNGELLERVEQLEDLLKDCSICPWECGINRFEDASGVCRSGYLPYISSICDHHGEEPVLSGSRGSGTVFFGGCNLRCVFCQNYQISQDYKYYSQLQKDFKTIAKEIVDLQNEYGVHNINFVSPSHFAPQMARIIYEAAKMGLHIPIVYNSNAYDSLQTLRLLNGVVDIYLPDLKYADDSYAKKYSSAKNYVQISRAAIKEMFRQVGLLRTDKQGIAQKGLIVRHLILPNDLAGTEENLTWLANALSPDVTVGLMSQYYPAHKARGYPLISRGITYSEYTRAVQALEKLAMHNGLTQHMESPEFYRPDFLNEKHPFKR